MRSVLCVAAAMGLFAALAGSAFAQSRYPACAEAQARVQREGAAVIYTAPHIYDRYVAHAGFCPPGDSARRVFTPTKDSPACMIGFVCVTGDPFDNS